MRKDSLGLFWEDVDYKTDKQITFLIEEGWEQSFPGLWCEKWQLEAGENPRDICISLKAAYAIAKKNQTGAKAEPPEPTWLDPSYLPGLQESIDFDIGLISDEELVEYSFDYLETGKKHELIFDIESYWNYALIAFMSVKTGKVIYFESYRDYDVYFDVPKLEWIFEKFTCIGFNSKNYDMIMSALAVNYKGAVDLKTATNQIIQEGARGYNILKSQRTKAIKGDHVDLIEVAPLFASLKIYGGRMHSQRMQDLPFHPEVELSIEQITIVRWYCVNDLRTTYDLRKGISKEIEIREKMSDEYGLDLRSKSDAQIAEAVIASELGIKNKWNAAPVILPGTAYKYQVPDFIEYRSELMKYALEVIRNVDFVVGKHGSITLPDPIEQLAIKINQTDYKLGIGGLHSMEKNASHFAGVNHVLKDVDVRSYYPELILRLGLYPQHLGPQFLSVYKRIVDTRIAAKVAGDKSTADTLKIVVNGSFGKFGSKYSLLYSPDLLIQVTISGQLSLLMLIEELELNGIPVVSANTDGIVIKCHKSKQELMEALVKDWEDRTLLVTEETVYSSLHSRDVNNYIAIKHPDTYDKDTPIDKRFKVKGIFATPGLSKNPQNYICIDAVKHYLLNHTPLQETIRTCTDIRKFITVRTAKGGAVKISEGVENLYLGKAIRWYYGAEKRGQIVYAKSGNKVPRSEGAVPVMDLPDSFPTDIDYAWYEAEASKILKQLNIHH